jgi:NTE family protein
VTDSLADLPRPLAYVLSGGGPLGAIQVGMLRALAEQPIRPDLIVGVSAGAINGALVAADPEGAASRLEATWSALNRDQVFPGRALWHLLTLRRHPDHVFPATGLKEVIEREAGSLRIEDLPVRFAAVAVDASNGEPFLFDRGPLAPVLLATSAIPAVYPPVEIDGRLYYDGGIAGNVPLRWALELGAASIVVLDCRISQDPTRVPRTVGQAIAFSLAVMIGRHAHEELDHVSSEVPVVYLPGPSGARKSLFDFSHTAELMDAAYRPSRAFLAELEVDGPGVYGDPGAIRDPHPATGPRRGPLSRRGRRTFAGRR